MLKYQADLKLYSFLPFSISLYEMLFVHLLIAVVYGLDSFHIEKDIESTLYEGII